MPYNINFKWALGVQNVLFNYLSIIIIIIIILISPPSFLSYRKHQRAAHLPRIRRLPVEPRQRTDPCSSLTTSTNKNPETIDYRAAKIFDIRSWFGFFFFFFYQIRDVPLSLSGSTLWIIIWRKPKSWSTKPTPW